MLSESTGHISAISILHPKHGYRYHAGPQIEISVGDDDDLGIRLEGLDPKRSVDAQQRGIPRRDGHCMRWDAGGIY